MRKRDQLTKDQEAALYLDAMIQIYEAVPCILHCENRTGEAILKRILVKKFNSIGIKKQQMEFISDFEEMANTKILGKQDVKSNWRLATTKSSEGTTIIADQTMTNQNTRSFIDNFELVALMCIDDDTE
jgi:hypothetical protein